MPYLPADCPRLSPNRLRQYSSEKVIVAGMTRRLEAVWDDGSAAGAVPTVQVLQRADGCPLSLKCVLGLLNSRLLNWVFQQHYASLALSGGYLRIGVPQVGSLPIAMADASDPSTRQRHDEIVVLVETMLRLHRELAAAGTAGDKTSIQRQIATADRQIDRLVYKLYGLTDAEIAMVEGAA
jgi:hypothetical protein